METIFPPSHGTSRPGSSGAPALLPRSCDRRPRPPGVFSPRFRYKKNAGFNMGIHQDFYDISRGFLWEFYGITMGFNGDLNGNSSNCMVMSMGFQWGFNYI